MQHEQNMSVSVTISAIRDVNLESTHYSPISTHAITTSLTMGVVRQDNSQNDWADRPSSVRSDEKGKSEK